MNESATRSLIAIMLSVAGTALITSGIVRYVNGNHVSKQNITSAGRDPNTPYSTLSYALTQVAAGDVVIVADGHTEAVTATSLAPSTAKVRIIGLGLGRWRPVFTFSLTASNVICNAASVSFENCVFDLTGIDAVVAGFTVSAADVAFLGCEFIINSATTGCVQGIVTAATADRLRVEGCRFLGPAVNSGTTTTACIDHEAGVDYVIRDNYFTGKMTQAITNAATVLRGLIKSNVFVIATGTKAINMAAASTPMVEGNSINVPSGVAPVIAAAGFMAKNSYSAAPGVTAGAATTF